jgi:hypothetical protein
MKRFACHRLYGADGKLDFHSKVIVCVDETGLYHSFSPLQDEVRDTEWIGGIVLLSETEDMKLEPDFACMLQKYLSSDKGAKYAWHISDFDFAGENLTSQSVLRRLK